VTATPITTTDQAVDVVLPGIVPPDGLQLRRRAIAPLGPHQALVRVEATGVSFAEQQMRRGRYFDQPPFPIVPGYDFVGIVAALGEEVTGFRVGDRVAAMTGTGAWTDRATIDAADLVPVPAGIDPVSAEAVMVNGLTAYRMLHRTARVQPGQTVAVFGAAGGVGSTLLQMARAAGVRAIGIVSGGKADAVRSLGGEPIDHSSEDVASRVRALAPEGVSAVFDHRGGDALRESFGMLAAGGTLVAYGVAAFRDASGDPMASIYASLTILQELQASGDTRRAAFFNVWEGKADNLDQFRADQRADLAAVFQLVIDGAIAPVIAAEFPLERAADALTLAESGRGFGKIILRP
jgi:NADPH:quinone reductase-like Zn-dependent oxidoreductase